ncbi:MAG: prohibitin family protein [Chitinispirillales bacterium]|jgi:regulator of protease activity HflC (stomatin/prohibitin superfamily)|nr:prohibitin family protein [Chitinispirillales bacterium]
MNQNHVSESPGFAKIGIIIGTAIVILVGLAYCTFYIVRAGEKAILFTFGEIVAIRDEGLHVRIPFVQTVQKISTRTQKAEVPVVAASKNMQTVSGKLSLNFRLDPDRIDSLYKKVGLNYSDKIIFPRMQETFKAMSAQYVAEELLTKREDVRNDIQKRLKNQLAEYYIVVNEGDVQITDFDFSPEYNKAIEEKQVAEQLAQKALYEKTRAQTEGETRIIHAQAEATAIEIQTKAIQSQGGKEYVNLKAIEKWNGALPAYNGGALPFVQIPSNKMQ